MGTKRLVKCKTGISVINTQYNFNLIWRSTSSAEWRHPRHFFTYKISQWLKMMPCSSNVLSRAWYICLGMDKMNLKCWRYSACSFPEENFFNVEIVTGVDLPVPLWSKSTTEKYWIALFIHPWLLDGLGASNPGPPMKSYSFSIQKKQSQCIKNNRGTWRK